MAPTQVRTAFQDRPGITQQTTTGYLGQNFYTIIKIVEATAFRPKYIIKVKNEQGNWVSSSAFRSKEVLVSFGFIAEDQSFDTIE